MARVIPVKAIALIAAIAVVASTPLGGWMLSFVGGSGLRSQDAYRALDMMEPEIPGSSAEGERLRIAWALVDGDKPKGSALDRRIHRPGTLARLRYETLDDRNVRMDLWDVRALVPSVGNGAGPVWDEGCPSECHATIAAAKGVRLERSGEPGIAAEWVLRMPVGETFELGSRTLETHDLMDESPKHVSLTSRRGEGGRFFNVPANIRVTLVEACEADVRVGSVTTLDVFPFAILPIPRGFSTTRWVQLNRCGSLAPLSTPSP